MAHRADELGRASGPVTFTRIDAWRVAIPMLEPFRISSGEVSREEAIVVRVTDGKHFGWGESSAMPGSFYSFETPDYCETELTGRILPELTGRSFPHMLALEAALSGMSGSRFVRVAVETAAWEMLARHAGLSVRALFGIPD